MIKKAKDLVNTAVKQIKRYQTGEDTPMVTRFDIFNRNALGGIFKGNIITLAGTSGCVDNKTEYFNGIEWKYISEYTEGDKVLQYLKDGSSELVIPSKFHKYKEANMWRIKSKYGVNQCLSAEHNVVYITSKGNLYSKPFHKVHKQHESTICGFQGKFINHFKYLGLLKPDLTPTELRFVVAIQADGHLIPNSKKRIRFNLKKERKKERLRALLNLLVQEGVAIKWSENVKPTGYSEFYIKVPTKFRVKEFPKDWFNLPFNYREAFFDEILHWDGSQESHTYYNTNKQSAEVCQFIFTTLGYRSRITLDNRVGKPLTYQVNYTTRKLTSISSSKHAIQKYEEHDGYKYCFTVPSSMLIFRREGVIFVTGNSGKSYLLQQLETDVFNKELNPDCDDYVLLRVNWEMSVFKLLLRRLKSSLGETLTDLLFKEPSKEVSEKMKIECDAERIENIYYLEDPTSPEDFYRQVGMFLQEHKDKKQVFVSIDHIALVLSKNGNKKQAIDETVEYIIRMVKEYPNASFIPITQLNRDIEGRTDVRFLSPRRSDIYASDTIFQASDMVVVIHNPYKLGFDKYMSFETKDYKYLTEFMTKPSDRKSNFATRHLIFHHFLKIREIDDSIDKQDIHIENINTTKNNSEPIVLDLEESGFRKIEDLETSPEFEENAAPF